MNLKEAFRYQNQFQRLMYEAISVVNQSSNVTKVEHTALLHKVNPEAEDQITLETPDSPYADQITQMTAFLMFLLEERERLSRGIRDAKAAMDIDFDGEVSLNGKRQELSDVFRRMCQIRSSETLRPGAGIGYKFNAEGNQVSYRCDLKTVTTINFDRNKVRALASSLSKKADQVSAELDRQTVNTQVAYEAPFDVNDSFAEVFQWFLDQNS